MSDKQLKLAKIAKQLLDKGETKLAKEVLALTPPKRPSAPTPPAHVQILEQLTTAQDALIAAESIVLNTDYDLPTSKMYREKGITKLREELGSLIDNYYALNEDEV